MNMQALQSMDNLKTNITSQINNLKKEIDDDAQSGTDISDKEKYLDKLKNQLIELNSLMQENLLDEFKTNENITETNYTKTQRKLLDTNNKNIIYNSEVFYKNETNKINFMA